MPYRNGDDGIELLHRLLPDGTRPLWLFITDDDPPPWPCVSGDATTLLEMLREQRFFEYFVVDTEVRWIVFDTHHNELIGFGEGFSPK